MYRPLIITWLLMLGLLGASIGAVVLVPGQMQHAFSLLCATLVAALVVSQFMGLRSASGIIRLFALGGVFWLALLFLLTVLEVLTR